ncbi:trace amine-associated receptor 1-like [Erpetoichthys calabaricus]|uniref:trace amine-associated receptor 1-like n=1 Tax=Erpetoichthys calabaricus TaxID=27687 RepID=UPI0022347090|nr:trace amine-associated receptor 1-like [Erpetoichthys calabaricus]
MNYSQNQNNKEFCFKSINGSCPKTSYPFYIRVPLYLFFGTAIVITVLGNLMVIVSICHFKQLHTPTNFLLLSLASTDLLLGGFIMAPSMIRSLESCWYFGDLFCKIHVSLDITLSTASLIHLLFISIDRYCAVCYPLHYQTKITSCAAGIMIAISWIFAGIYGCFMCLNIQGLDGLQNHKSQCLGGCLYISSPLSGLVSSLLCFYFPGFIMLGIYTNIFIVASRQAKIIKQTEQRGQTAKEKKMAVSMKQEKKAARTLGITIGCFFICWLPFFLYSFINTFVQCQTSAFVTELLYWFGYLNSAFNPFIYAFMFNWFRKSFQIILYGKIFKPNSSRIKLVKH